MTIHWETLPCGQGNWSLFARQTESYQSQSFCKACQDLAAGIVLCHECQECQIAMHIQSLRWSHTMWYPWRILYTFSQVVPGMVALFWNMMLHLPRVSHLCNMLSGVHPLSIWEYSTLFQQPVRPSARWRRQWSTYQGMMWCSPPDLLANYPCPTVTFKKSRIFLISTTLSSLSRSHTTQSDICLLWNRSLYYYTTFHGLSSIGLHSRWCTL